MSITTDEAGFKDRLTLSAETVAYALYTSLINPRIARPARALILAYSYVLSGKKVEEPYKWGTI